MPGCLVPFGRPKPVTVLGRYRDEARQIIWGRRARITGDRPSGFLEPFSEPRVGDDELDHRLAGDVPEGMRLAAGYLDVVALVPVLPFQAMFARHQRLLRAGDDQERFCAVVTVDRHDGTARAPPPPHTNIAAS